MKFTHLCLTNEQIKLVFIQLMEDKTQDPNSFFQNDIN